MPACLEGLACSGELSSHSLDAPKQFSKDKMDGDSEGKDLVGWWDNIKGVPMEG